MIIYLKTPLKKTTPFKNTIKNHYSETIHTPKWNPRNGRVHPLVFPTVPVRQPPAQSLPGWRRRCRAQGTSCDCGWERTPSSAPGSQVYPHGKISMAWIFMGQSMAAVDRYTLLTWWSLDWLFTINGLVEGKCYRKTPWSSWENRWFPVEIFPWKPVHSHKQFWMSKVVIMIFFL